MTERTVVESPAVPRLQVRGEPAPYSPALKIDLEGPHSFVFVAGQTTTMDDTGQPVGGESIEAQARQTLENIEAILNSCGASLRDVVQLTAFVAKPEFIEPYLALRRELFVEPYPASATVVAGLGRPDLLIEIQAVAVI